MPPDLDRDRELIARLNTALEAGAPSAAIPNGVAFFRLVPIEFARLLALAERGIAERADVVAFLRDPLWIATARRALAVAADDIERGAHVGAAGVGKPEGGA